MGHGSMADVDPIDPDDSPCAVFRFRCRPRGRFLMSSHSTSLYLNTNVEILQALGIIPAQSHSTKSPSPGPSTNKRRHSDSGSSRQVKVKLEQQPDACVERQGSIELVDLTPSSPIRVPKDLQGKVYDLTDD